MNKIMSNNNNPQIPYGNDGTQPIGQNPNILRDYLKQEHENSQKVIDDGRPTITPQKYADEIEAGTILQSHVFEHSSSGVSEVNSYSVNNTDEWERQARQADLDALGGRTVYNTAPSVSVMPNVATSEPPKPTQEQLAQQVKQAQINSLTNKINRYQQELSVFQMKVINAEISLKKAKDQLSELEGGGGN